MQLKRHKSLLIGVLLSAVIVGYFVLRALMGTPTSYVTASRSSLVQTVVATGRIETPARIEIASRALGHITQILADEGDPPPVRRESDGT